MDTKQRIAKLPREQYLDISKGIAMTLIVIAHSGLGFPFGLDQYFTAFYIPIFFIISGYLSHNINNIQVNIKSRSQRILKPYFLYSVLLFFVLLPLNIIKRTLSVSFYKTTILGILYSRYCIGYPINQEANPCIMTICNAPMWYLTCAMISFILFYLSINFFIRNNLFKIIILVILLALTALLKNLSILLPWSLDVAPFGTFFMLIGFLLKDSQFFHKSSRWHKILCFCIMGFFYIILCHINPDINLSVRQYGMHGYLSILLCAVIGISGSISCLLFSQLLPSCILGRTFAWIGRHTIPILAFHAAILAYISYFVSLIP